MSNINSVVLSGNLGADPEIRYFDNDKKVATANMCVKQWCANGNRSMWLKVETWGEQARIFAESARKGMRITVAGELDVEVWTPKDGVQREKFKVKANKIEWPYTEREQTEPQQQEAVITF